jgi:hypothetical protein
VWPEILIWLQETPDAPAKTLFLRLQEQYPGEYPDGQLRTLQRRVKEWRKIMARKLIYADLDGDVYGKEIIAIGMGESPAGR